MPELLAALTETHEDLASMISDVANKNEEAVEGVSVE